MSDRLMADLVRSLREIGEAGGRRAQAIGTASSSAMDHIQRWWNPMTARGDIVYGGPIDGELRRRQIGAEGKHLCVEGGVPVWGDCMGGECNYMDGWAEIDDFFGTPGVSGDWVQAGPGGNWTATLYPFGPPQIAWGITLFQDTGIASTGNDWTWQVAGTTAMGAGGGFYLLAIDSLDNWGVAEVLWTGDNSDEWTHLWTMQASYFDENPTLEFPSSGTFRMTLTKVGGDFTTTLETPTGTTVDTLSTPGTDWETYGLTGTVGLYIVPFTWNGAGGTVEIDCINFEVT